MRRAVVPRGMSGAELLLTDNVDAARAARDVVLGRALRAREDVCEFFEFVMRSEHEQAPVKLMPHQRLAFEFIQAHSRTVNIFPVGHSKTYLSAALTLWLMGRNPTLRGVIMCAAEAQASKVLSLVRDYIEASRELRLVFPHLRPSPREGDPWTQTQLTIDRPRGIKDPTLVAAGLDSKRIVGSRLSWVIIDDVLNRENSNTEEQRVAVREYLDSSVLSRIDVAGGKAVVLNTPWHPKDVVHQLEELGWATMRMGIDGDIIVRDDKQKRDFAKEHDLPWQPWDSALIRARTRDPNDEACRLVAHDPDPQNQVRLWPERFTDQVVAQLQFDHLPYEYNRLYRCICRDDETNMCKVEYVERSKLNARKLGVHSMVTEYRGPNPTFTGVDLAVDVGPKNDQTAFFTFEARPDGMRVILDVDVGQWAGPDILRKLFQKQQAYQSIVCVESNAAQKYIKQFALEVDKAANVKARTTGRAKAHPQYGVAGFFLEMANGGWAFPNDKHHRMHPQLTRLVDACIYYVPDKHTADVLMAVYMAREQARDWGIGPKRPEGFGGPANIGASIMSR